MATTELTEVELGPVPSSEAQAVQAPHQIERGFKADPIDDFSKVTSDPILFVEKPSIALVERAGNTRFTVVTLVPLPIVCTLGLILRQRMIGIAQRTRLALTSREIILRVGRPEGILSVASEDVMHIPLQRITGATVEPESMCMCCLWTPAALAISYTDDNGDEQSVRFKAPEDGESLASKILAASQQAKNGAAVTLDAVPSGDVVVAQPKAAETVTSDTPGIAQQATAADATQQATAEGAEAPSTSPDAPATDAR
eukprot:Opistho-1_new@8662